MIPHICQHWGCGFVATRRVTVSSHPLTLGVWLCATHAKAMESSRRAA